MHVNSPAWADENQLKCEKVRFLWMKLTEDESLSIFKSEHILRVHLELYLQVILINSRYLCYFLGPFPRNSMAAKQNF